MIGLLILAREMVRAAHAPSRADSGALAETNFQGGKRDDEGVIGSRRGACAPRKISGQQREELDE